MKLLQGQLSIIGIILSLHNLFTSPASKICVIALLIVFLFDSLLYLNNDCLIFLLALDDSSRLITTGVLDLSCELLKKSINSETFESFLHLRTIYLVFKIFDF